MNPINSRPKSFWLCLLLIVATTAFVYARVYTSGFISWDDPELVLHNKDVQQFTIPALFSEYYAGNYMPLTMLVYALNWSIFQDASFGYHFCSIFLHCLNGILVFILSYKILKDQWKALICALIFSLHPLQTESVAWVAEIKTVLFAFFFLWALILYVKYLESDKPKNLYAWIIVLFILSVLSKPAAICFPLCLFCIDLIRGRIFDKKAWFEKIPFFAISLIIGLLMLYTQQQDKYINTEHAFAWYQRIGFAGYAMLSYLGSFLLPVNQSVIYPYPQHTALALMVGSLFMAAFVIMLYFLYRKKQYPLLGMIFFVFSNLLLILQFVPFGEVLTADRYMYLPVIGLSWILLYMLRLKATTYKIIGIALIITLGTLSFSRSKVWQNSITLYNDIIKKYPDSFVALNSLGAEYMLQGNTKMAYTYLNKAASGSPGYYKAYYNRGLLNTETNKFEDAISDFTKAIELGHYIKAYTSRANVYYTTKDYSKAIADAMEALRLEPANLKANIVLANSYESLNELDKAIYYYNAAIALSPDESLLYLRRAILYGKQKNFEMCIHDLDSCLQRDSSNAEAYYWKGVAKVNLKQNSCAEFREAYRLGLKEAENAMNKFCR